MGDSFPQTTRGDLVQGSKARSQQRALILAGDHRRQLISRAIQAPSGGRDKSSNVSVSIVSKGSP